MSGNSDTAEQRSTAAESIGALLSDLVRTQVDAVLALEGPVRQDRPESVHDLRVAVRRLRGTLRAHRRSLDRDAAGPLAERLRRLGRSLSDARDSQVIGELLAARLAELPRAERPGPMGRRISSWSAGQYRHGRHRVLAVLDGAEYTELRGALERFAAAPLRPERAARAARPELRRVLRHEQKRMRRRTAAAGALPAGPDRDRALHAVRRAAKRARYLAEAAEPVCGKPARRLARRMRAVQTLLGERQDTLLTRWALPRIAASGHSHGEPGFGYGVLYAAGAAELARCDTELPGVCAAAGRRRLARRL